MAKKTIAQVDVAGKRALIRVDFNVPIEDGAISDDRRIREALPTIKSVLDRGGSCVLLSHLGRPEGKGFEPEYSLRPVAARLGELLGRPVLFPSNDCTDAATGAAVAALKPGQVVLCENVRFAAGEKKGEASYAAKVAGYGDLYVNDAFGTAHREDGSMFAVPKAMAGKPRVAGLLLQKELKYLGDALAKPAKPFVVVLGGAKVSDKIPLVQNLLPKADAILIGGAMAYTFLKALGRNVGASRVEESHLAAAKKMLDDAAKMKCDLHLPQDHVCSTQFSENAGDIKVCADAIPAGYMGLDIGPKTQLNYGMVLSEARTVVWNGPMGVFEWKPFRVGTQMVAQAIVDATANGATSIVGGGDSAAAAEAFGLASKFSHVSTGGGASLEMLSGKPFTTVALLDEA
ncbi:MAG: phosphoglycerate kinase [Phycisphaerae bacterium]|nr:phosphoglycerate kinase [Phycisphaerae bacterium]